MDDLPGEGAEPFGYQGHYVSCMKINGVPLLPPLMTQECRHEMQYYKRLAVAVERRISELKVCLDDSTLDDTNNHPSDTEECFDGTNISYDINHERSSLSERNNLNYDQSITAAADISECSRLDDCFDNNEFESINSQVTIIDFSSENPNCNSQPTHRADHQLSLSEELKDFSTEEKATNFILEDVSANITNTIEHEPYECDNNVVLKSGKCTINVQESLCLASTDTESNDRNSGKVKPQTNSDSKVIKNISKNNTSSKENKKPNSVTTKIIPKTSVSTGSPKNKRLTVSKSDTRSPYQSVTGSKKNTIKTKERALSDFSKSRKKLLTIEHNKLSPSKNVTGSLNNISSGLISPPKLVRQNSYTLESPSPLLLAHLEVQSMTSGVDVGSISMSEATSTSQLYVPNKNAWDIDMAKKTWTSMKSDISSISKNMSGKSKKSNKTDNSQSRLSTKTVTDNTSMNKTPSRNTTDAREVHNTSSKKSSISNINERREIHNQAIKENKISHDTMPPESLESKAGVQNAFVNKFMELNKSVEALYNDPNSKPIKESPNIYLNYIMKKFNEDHEKQMLELMKKQQEEQLLLQKTFENQQQLLMAQFETAFVHAKDSNLVKKHEIHSEKVQRNSTVKDAKENKIEKHRKQSIDKEFNKHQQDISYIEGNTEKYLTISADVLNKSRCLLINRKTVNLSPTDIQCVNVMPVQSKVSCILNDIDMYNSDKTTSSHSNGSHYSKKSNGKHEISENDRNSVNLVPKSQELNRVHVDNTYYEDIGNEPLDTGRTSNTLDDLNFTFTSDDVSHTNKLYLEDNKNKTGSSPYYNDVGKEQEKALKLRNALSKISEIQKSLAAQPYSQQRRSSHMGGECVFEDKYLSENDQNISLSSIDAMPNFYSDSQSQRNFVDRNSLSLNLTEINKPSGNRQLIKKKKTPQEIEREAVAATKIVAHCKGYLTRRLMKTERVESTVQTIRDTLLCALQLHRDEGGIQGADVDLHRRLIQQITAACYALHDMFITCSPAERMSIISQDRDRRLLLSHRSSSGVSPLRQLSATTQRTLKRKLDGMSRSHSGVFTSRSARSIYHPSNVMTRSHYEQSDHIRGGIMDKARRSVSVAGDHHSRKPWR